MANCCCNNSRFAGCGSIFGCNGGWRPVYGPTGPMGPMGLQGPAAPVLEQAFAQMAQEQTVANGDLYAMTPQATRAMQRDIVPSGNSVSLQPGTYLISYIVGTNGAPAGDYRVTPMLNGAALPLYSAGDTAVAGEQSSVSATFIINVIAASVFQLQAGVSAASMTQNVGVSILKIV